MKEAAHYPIVDACKTPFWHCPKKVNQKI